MEKRLYPFGHIAGIPEKESGHFIEMEFFEALEAVWYPIERVAEKEI